MRKSMEERDEGFTLIELLVVIIIIGILAAIAIPTFLNQRKKGWDAASKSTLRNAATAQESYFTDNNAYTTAVGTPPGTTADLAGQGFNPSASSPVNVISADATHYCMHTKTASGADYYIASNGANAGAPTTVACT